MDEHLKQLLEVSIQNLSSDDGWELFKQDVYVHDFPKSVYPIIKIVKTFNFPIGDVVNYIWGLKENDFKRLNQWITTVRDHDETENYRIREILTSYAWPIWPRQTVIQMQKIVDGDTNTPWILQKSFTSTDYPEKEQHVRSTWIIGAYKFVDMGNNKTQVIRLLHFDEGGNVPTMFVYHNHCIEIHASELAALEADMTEKNTGVI